MLNMKQYVQNALSTSVDGVSAVLRSALLTLLVFLPLSVAHAATITSTANLTYTGLAAPIPATVLVTTTNVAVVRTPAQIEFLHFNNNTSVYTPASLYHAGQMIYVQVTDGDQNLDPSIIETVQVTVDDDLSTDSVTFTLTETGPNTGVFIGSVQSVLSTAAVVDQQLSVAVNSSISASYTDPLDAVTTVAAAALVDPFGVMFDSSTGTPIDGVVVTIINAATGLPALVYGDDGVSAYPSTVTTGGTATDASGAVYNFSSGNYRFPLMNTGTYYLSITPPLGYSFPSQATDASIQALPTAAAQPAGAYTLVPASRGATFTIAAGPAIRIDVPLDSKGVNLFIQKTASTPSAAFGDRVAYNITVENVHATAASTTSTVTDTLPLGFRYQANSAALDGAPLPNPSISADGRTLTFNLGTIAALSSKVLTYTAVVGANSKLGLATNIATASGVMGATNVTSNVSKAVVNISEDLIRSKGFIAGVVFIDDNMNELQDDGEEGVPGIRIFMEDGRSVITDTDGRYHFDGVTLGGHVLQMDKVTIKPRYRAVALTQTRFSDNDFSQFADVNAGGLVRANFRLVNRAPKTTPVTVIHALSESDGLVWADVDVKRGDNVDLFTLDGFYTLPNGWKYIEGTASIDGEPAEPEVTLAGFAWKLDPAKAIQHIRLAMKGDGESGLKQAIAYARFTSPGTKKGRTGLAKLNIKDTLTESRDQRSFVLNIRFGNRKADLPEQELEKLESLIQSLQGLVIREMIVEGHTNNIPIAPRNRNEFANNKVLSQARADYIAQYFKEKLHLADDVVAAIGKGAAEPIADNNTAQGRKLNRRVVLKIRADKITHDFAFALQDRLADAYGEAQDSWDYEEVVQQKDAASAKQGILFPNDGMSMPSKISSIRVVMDSSLKIKLSLDGEPISDDNIGFKSVDPKTGKTIYTYIGIDFGKPGKHVLNLQGVGPFGNARVDETVTVIRTGAISRIKLIETGVNIADGKTPVRFKLEVKDNRGELIGGGIELQQLGGDLRGKLISKTSSVAAESEKSIRVGQDGWVELAPVSRSGTHRIVLGSNDVQESIEIYVKPEVRDWILVGFAEGTVGYNQLSGAVQPINQANEGDKFYKDGRVAFYAKGKVSGDFLLTMSYDTQAKQGTDKNSRFGDIDPNSMYTIYGDKTNQQFDGTSSKKLYLKIEKDSFYALFGDYNTGLSTTELSRYSRTFTGVKAELHEDKIGFTAFATQTSQTAIKDDIRGNGTSGLYRLSRQNILTNSETIRIETVDRFKSEVILDSIQLTRHLDYDIDYVLGTIWFKQPVLSKDASLNPIMIRVEYESDDKDDQFTVAGGRVYVKPTDNIEVGGTFVSEGYLGGSNTLSGADAKIQVSDNIEVRAEAATSTTNNVTAQAWKVEGRLTGEQLSGTAYARSQDDNFGLGQQLGSENSTIKVGVDAQYRLDEDSSLNAEVFRQEVSNTGAVRDMASVQYNQQFDETLKARAGVRVNRDVDGAGNETGTTLGSVGATKQLSNRLSLRVDHEESLAANNGVDFPSRSQIGVDYRVTAETTLSATQEWTRGNSQDTSSTRVGVKTTPWNGGQMSTSYEQQLGDNGKRSFANAGLLQTWKFDETLTFSASIDRTKVLSDTATAPVQLNFNAPVATGGESFTAYSIGANYKPGTWTWTNRLEYRTSDLSTHRGASMGIQGHIHDNLTSQFTLLLQKDVLASNALTYSSRASLRAAWRPSYDQLILLNRFDIRSDEATGGVSDTKSQRYINNMTANWQSYDAWQLRFNHGIKLTDETIGASSWSGLTDLLGMQLTYDLNADWDLTLQAATLRVRHLNNAQTSAGFALGYNMFDDLWLSAGYNFVGFYDQDFTAAEYAREGLYLRFLFKFDQSSLEEWIK